ncbi:MAG: hypothetical protein U1F43_34600 [Myxococcota bacterium]
MTSVPRASAPGSTLTSTGILAPCGQPKLHLPAPWQSTVLRRSDLRLTPSLFEPFAEEVVLRERMSTGTSWTRSIFLDVVEVGREARRRQLAEAEVPGPAMQDLVGRAQADAAGDARRAADALAHRDVDHRRVAEPDGEGHAAVAPRGASTRRAHAAVHRPGCAALLEHDDRAAGGRALGGDGQAAGAVVFDDDDVGVELEAAGDVLLLPITTPTLRPRVRARAPAAPA